MDRPVTREQMVALDRWAIQVIGIPGVVLMEQAGRGVAEAACRMGDVAARPMLVLAGRGNNGGDGFVAARHLWSRGLPLRVRFLGPASQYLAGSDPWINLQAILRLGLDVSPLDLGALDRITADASLIIDALFGTGLRGAPRSPADRVIEAINQRHAAGVPVLAVDIPSGLDCNTGAVPGAAVQADRTVTFARPKAGFFAGRGPEHTGEVEVVDIGIPRAGPGCPVPGGRLP